MTTTFEDVASAPHLLVGLDFDGVLAHIVPRPEDAVPVDGVAEVLADLVELPEVRVAAVSGRRRDDLLDRLRPPSEVIVIGEHGADTGGDDDARPAQYDEVRDLLGVIAADYDGAWVEEKKTGLTLHSRALTPEVAEEVGRRTTEALDRVVPGTHALGHRVVDVRLTGVTKGDAVSALRQSGESVLYIGDDTTDESVFDTLGAGDLGVKVGPGETAASLRLPDPEAVVAFLRDLVSIRRR